MRLTEESEKLQEFLILNIFSTENRSFCPVVRDSVWLWGGAIVREPKVFLMDEPLSNLDAKLRVQMRIEISKLHQRLQSTIIYVTHDQTEAMTLGTRIVVMKDGVIQQVDSPQNLYDRPDNLFVAGFIGSPQMNFIDATVVKEGGELFLEYGEHHRVILHLRKQRS